MPAGGRCEHCPFKDPDDANSGGGGESGQKRIRQVSKQDVGDAVVQYLESIIGFAELLLILSTFHCEQQIEFADRGECVNCGQPFVKG